MPIYMKYEGLDGSVTTAGYEKWTELQSAQLGTNRHITNPSGAGTNREASAPAMSEIVCTKDQDDSSAALFKESLWGTGKTVKIHFLKTNKDKLVPYLEWLMTNTLVSNYSVSGHGGETHSTPMESLSLNFTKIEYKMIHNDPKNLAGKPETYTWDLATMKGS